MLTSVERINAPVCEELDVVECASPPTPVPLGWPTAGEVQFTSVCARYRPGLPLVLQDVSCRIMAGQHVGIVGRTGSGKTSFGLALFRALGTESGSIMIDGVDIRTLPVYSLRSKLSVIPQDPVLFSGTVRSNLDPFGEHDDSDMLAALEQVGLHQWLVGDTGNGDVLGKAVVLGGANFSSGQRQLLCFARALLRRSKVVVLDEATAAVDSETDAAVQRAMRQAFLGCTVLIVAHRLRTVMDCDKVITMCDGSIVEFGSPDVLIGNDVPGPDDLISGVFKSMVAQSTSAEA